jgi:hypothetical protein
MSSQAIVLAPVTSVSPASQTDTEIVRDSHRKLDEILEKLLADFRADVLKLAGTITSANVASFSIDGFVSSWTQLLERFRTRTGAVASFRTELGKVVDTFKREHAEELIAAFRHRVAALEKELRERNEVDSVIEKQIADIEYVIAELESLSAKQGPGQTAQVAHTRRTRGAGKAAKKATKAPAKKSRKKQV